MAQTTEKEIEIRSETVAAKIHTFGGMTTAAFRLPNGKTVRPFYENPWGTHGTDDVFLGHVKGDFFCLPFGADANAAGLPAHWQAKGAPRQNEYQHGYSCNGVYAVNRQATAAAELTLAYRDGEIESVRRRVEAGDGVLTFADAAAHRFDFAVAVG